jgi:hypothetical protein
VTEHRRGIGPIGTASRIVIGLFTLYLALVDGPPFADGFSWSLRWYDAALGLLVLPAIAVGVGLLACRRAPGSVRFMGPAATALNCVVIVVVVANPYTAGGALLFYGTMMLIAAARGHAGCEGTVLSNWILRRDDQIGCPTFTPIDAAEERFRRSRTASLQRSA